MKVRDVKNSVIHLGGNYWAALLFAGPAVDEEGDKAGVVTRGEVSIPLVSRRHPPVG